MVARADLVEADCAAALAVGAHDGPHTHDRGALLGGGEPELDLLADLQGAGSREQDPPAAEIDGVGLNGVAVAPGDHHHGPGGLDADVLALLDLLDGVGLVEAQQLAVLEGDGAPQSDPPAGSGELQRELLEGPTLRGCSARNISTTRSPSRSRWRTRAWIRSPLERTTITGLERSGSAISP